MHNFLCSCVCSKNTGKLGLETNGLARVSYRFELNIKKNVMIIPTVCITVAFERTMAIIPKIMYYSFNYYPVCNLS